MLRVHDTQGTSLARFDPTTSYTSITVDGRTHTWAVQPVCVLNASGAVRNVQLGYLEPDIFGDEITYPDYGLYHKWTSIRQFSVNGDLFPYNKSEVDRATGGTFSSSVINDLTGDNRVLPIFYNYGTSCRSVMNIGYDYGRYSPRFAGHRRGPMYRVRESVYLGNDIYYYVTWQLDLYEWDSGLSASPYSYSPLGSVSLSGVVVSICKYDFSNGVWRVRRSSLPNSIRNSVFTFVCEDRDSIPYHVSAWARELISLHKDELSWSGLSSTTTYASAGFPVEYITSLLRQPNFDAIFSSNRRNPNWSELAASAYSNLGMSDINGIAYLHDLIAMGSQVRSFASTLKSIPSNKVKSAASAWLAVHYGFKLMLLDTVTLRDTLRKESLRNSRKSKCQASTEYSYSDIRFRARYQVFYNQFERLEDELLKLQKLSDATITSENIWDMVPFSFVIDWFVSVGDVLQSLDNYAALIQEHRVIAAGRSIKGACKAKASQLGLPNYIDTGNVQLGCYFRRYARSLQPPSLLPSVTVNPFNHLIEGAALFISRK